MQWRFVHAREQRAGFAPSRRGGLGSPRQRGMTLVELMVGVLLAMLVTLGMLTLFSNASSNDRNLQRASLQIENGRYAAELLRDELQLAGFFGEIATQKALYANINPCDTTATGFVANPLTLPTPVRGYTASEALACISNRRAGTHAIALRRLDTATQSATAVTSGNLQPMVQYSFCPNDPPLQRLVQSNDRNAFTLRNRACNAANVVRPFVSRVYFVADCNRCTNGGDGVPTLKRLELVSGQLVETPLVEGIETLRFEYGFDTNGDGAADSFLAAAAATGEASKWENVVALRVHYVTRSMEKASGAELASQQTFELGGTGTVVTANDGYLRRVYSSTIRLVNPSGARETQ